MTHFAFCGSRSLPARCGDVAFAVVTSLPAGASVATGCASGADAMIRRACPAATVFSVASGEFGVGRAAFARRSAAMVQSIPLGGWVVGLVSGACPVGVIPAKSWRSGDSISGSWSSIALAVGRGLSVGILWCDEGDPILPVWPGGAWARVDFAPWSGAALFVPLWVWSAAPVQSTLF